MLNDSEKIMCSWCGGKSNVNSWEESTYKECNSREKRRAYTSIYKEEAFNRKTNTFYKCPMCNTWLRGSQLRIVDTDNKMHLKLGGEPVILKSE